MKKFIFFLVIQLYCSLRKGVPIQKRPITKRPITKHPIPSQPVKAFVILLFSSRNQMHVLYHTATTLFLMKLAYKG